MSTLDWLMAKPIAHRGLHDKARGVVENTLSAARAAMAYGFAIECDVQLTSDDNAVVFHDFDLKRLTAEQGKVADYSLAALKTVAISGTASDTIPSLDDFLSAIGGQVPLVVEIKSRFDGDMRLTRRVCDTLARYDGPVVIKSFDPQIVATVRAIAPTLTRGIVAQLHYDSPSDSFLSPETKHSLANLLHFEDSQPHFISWKVTDLQSAPPYLCRLLGHLPVMAWTVRTEEDRILARRHADQMVFEGFVP